MELKVGLLASFTVDPIVAYLGTALDAQGISAAVEVGPFDQIVQGLLDLSSLPGGRPDVAVVWPRLEDLWARDCIPVAADDSTRSHEQLLNIGAQVVAQAATGVTIILVLPSTPWLRPLGVGDAGNVHGVAASAARTREALRALVAEAPGVMVADADDMLSELGRRAAIDPRRMAAASVPYTEEAFAFLADRIATLLRLERRGATKVAVLDADNTLWGGVVGEDGAAALDLADQGPGSSFREFQTYLAELRRAGLLLTVASKNNEEDAWAGFSRPEMVLRRDDLAAWRVSWKPKSESIADMADELNLGLGAMVFIDDSGAEIAEVAAALKEVRSLQMPTDPAGWFEAIAMSGLLDRLPPTNSDFGRAGSYHLEAQRRTLRESTSVGDYLRSLDLMVAIHAPDGPGLARLAQLVAKTNQFTLGGHRHSAAEIAQLADDPSVALGLVDVSDAFGDYGTVGAFIVRQRDGEAALDTFVLSCRAMGRGVEDAMLAEVGAFAGSVMVEVVETGKNTPLRLWLSRFGVSPGVSAAIAPVPWPDHITRIEDLGGDHADPASA